MTVGMTDAGDLAETAFLNLLTDKQMNGVAASEKTRVEDDTCGINGLRHFVAIPCADAQRLFSEYFLFGLSSRNHQLFMTVGFRANNNGLNLSIRPNLG